MNKPLRVLIVEDSENDALLILRELQRGGYTTAHQRVDTASAMSAALEKQPWDIVISDYVMPAFSGLAALKLLQESNLDLPCIIVSGKIGEDTAVAAMKAGASNYIMKDNLTRLGSAVERELHEAATQQEHKKIADTLRQREEELRLMRNMDQLKDEFLGLVSHELRTPLTVIMGALGTLLVEMGRLSQKETHQLLQDAVWETESLSRLLTDLLELSRFQAGRLSLSSEPVSVGSIIKETVEKISPQSPIIHRFVIDLPKALPKVQADPVRLEHILYNLLENAVKYSPQGGQIQVSVKSDKENLLIGVRDEGIGISISDQARLFKPFERIVSTRLDSVGGTGLGLVVCRRLVEAHGGRIWVESEPDHGSTFFFTLPLS